MIFFQVCLLAESSVNSFWRFIGCGHTPVPSISCHWTISIKYIKKISFISASLLTVNSVFLAVHPELDKFIWIFYHLHCDTQLFKADINSSITISYIYNIWSIVSPRKSAKLPLRVSHFTRSFGKRAKVHAGRPTPYAITCEEQLNINNL